METVSSSFKPLSSLESPGYEEGGDDNGGKLGGRDGNWGGKLGGWDGNWGGKLGKDP